MFRYITFQSVGGKKLSLQEEKIRSRAKEEGKEEEERSAKTDPKEETRALKANILREVWVV